MRYAITHKRDYKSLSVLGFEKNFHGLSFGTLSCADPAQNKNNYPTYDWPRAPLPSLKYPLSHHEHENRAEEQRCLDAVSQLITSKRAEGKDIGAIIIETITSQGNHQATPAFYKKLRSIAAKEGIPFIADETKIGIGSTGKMWAHEHWYLSENDGGCPDIVTFANKTGISGFYSTLDYRVDPHCANFDQDVDFVKLLNFGVIWKEI